MKLAQKENSGLAACLSNAMCPGLRLCEVPRVPEQLQEDYSVGRTKGDPSLHQHRKFSTGRLLMVPRSSSMICKVQGTEQGESPPMHIAVI